MRRQHYVLGIDVGEHALSIVIAKHCQQKGVSIESVAHSLLYYGEENKITPSFLNHCIAECSKRRRYSFTTVVMSVPTDVVTMHMIECDAHLSDEETEAEVQLALQNVLPFSLEYACFDFSVIYADIRNQKNAVLIATCHKHEISQLEDMLPKRLLSRLSIDVTAFALLNILESAGAFSESPTAVIDMRLGAVHCYIFHHNQLVLFLPISDGSAHVKAHNVYEALSPYVSTESLSFGDMYITGVESCAHGIIDDFSNTFSDCRVMEMPVRQAFVSVCDNDGLSWQCFSIAAGLALRSLHGNTV